MGSNAVSTNDATTTTTTTTRKPGTNLAEIDPSAFAQTLSHRLEKVKESRGKMERLLSRMQPVSVNFPLLILNTYFWSHNRVPLLFRLTRKKQEEKMQNWLLSTPRS